MRAGRWLVGTAVVVLVAECVAVLANQARRFRG